jgi:hypothetical protein
VLKNWTCLTIVSNKFWDYNRKLVCLSLLPAELRAQQAHKPCFTPLGLGGHSRVPDNFNAIGVVENVQHRLIHLKNQGAHHMCRIYGAIAPNRGNTKAMLRRTMS